MTGMTGRARTRSRHEEYEVRNVPLESMPESLGNVQAGLFRPLLSVLEYSGIGYLESDSLSEHQRYLGVQVVIVRSLCTAIE